MQTDRKREPDLIQPATLASYFEGFKTFGDPSLEEARGEAINFCAAMSSESVPGYWLTLLGPSGTGKTMLARIITRYFNRRLDALKDENYNPSVEIRYRKGGFKMWASVVEDMLQGDFSGLRNLTQDWFVCLDDIGAEYERNRDLAVSKLYGILSARLGKFTVLTANLTLEEVNVKMDARIASRLLRDGNIVVDVTAPDFNLR